jgi:hypothetical protein
MFGAVHVFDLKCLIILKDKIVTGLLKNSVVDPDQYVFGPPGSAFGSVSLKYGYRTGSDLSSTSKNSRKNLDFYCFVTYL